MKTYSTTASTIIILPGPRLRHKEYFANYFLHVRRHFRLIGTRWQSIAARRAVDRYARRYRSNTMTGDV